MNKLILLFGLPCSGKTSWYNENIDIFKDYLYINADDIKKEFYNYNESEIGMFSDEAISEAKKRVFQAITDNLNIVMDAGGINRTYTNSIIQKAQSHNYEVTMYFINTPVHVCIDRNKNRTRKVPENLIYDKETRKLGMWFYYQSLGIKCIEVPYFTRKYLFFDMDGVLAVQYQLPRDANGDIDFVNSHYFEHLNKTCIVDTLKNNVESSKLSYENIFILSAAPNSIVIDEKKKWLKVHLPDIPEKNIFFVNQGIYKAEMFRDLSKYLKLDPKDMCLIEDTMSIVETVRFKYKMDSIHVSELLSLNFNFNEF